MNKTEFLDALRHALGKLPSYEVEQSIAFYAEMIDDRIEDGMSEQEAVAALGSVHAIAAQIVAETPPIPKAIAKANTGSRTLNIVLLAILSPIWVTLALAFACMVLAIYLAIWSVVVALWAVVLTLLLCAPSACSAWPGARPRGFRSRASGSSAAAWPVQAWDCSLGSACWPPARGSSTSRIRSPAG